MALSINSLCKSFDSKLVFKSFSYDFQETGVVCLLGESGVGKTTLLRIISGLDTDFTGTVSGGGIGMVSYAFQEPRLFPTVSALDNLVLAVFDKKTDAGKELALCELKSLGINESDAELLPSQLSGGMRQRVSLARAFLKEAPILLLDEPTKELDADNVTLVIERIKQEAEKRLVIVVTHREEDCERLCATKIYLS